MGCNGCTQGVNGLPEGCRSNGICSSDGGNKLTVFNWLSDVKIPTDQEAFDVVEVRFKNSRKGFYRNINNLNLNIGDAVAVEASPGHDIGVVSLAGELVKVQMRDKRVAADDASLLKVYRKATQRDLDIWKTARDREWETMISSRKIAGRLGLSMKISDVEYQGDNSKAIFYYTAEDRVDFRILIKELASTFSIRIEMKQIGLRQEAARIGGIGSCGRELCCSTWLTDFRSVTTTAARYQQLSLNPQKLAGQCGKLKCCLNFELDSYLDALKHFPETETVLNTEKGVALFQKMDIFKGIVWYSYKEEPMNWIPVSVSYVNEIIAANKKGEPISSLEEYSQEVVKGKKVEFHKVVGQDELTRFDVKKDSGKRRANLKKRRRSQHSGQTRQMQDGSKENLPAKTEEKRSSAKRPSSKSPQSQQSKERTSDQRKEISRDQRQGDKTQKPKPKKSGSRKPFGKNKPGQRRSGRNKEGGDNKTSNN